MAPLTPADTEAERLAEQERFKDLAYVQLLLEPSDICSSLLFFKTLSKQRSEVPGRVVMYPSSWLSDLASRQTSNATASASSPTATALLALKKAKEPLGLTLQPVNIPADTTPSAALIASPFLLYRYERIIYVRRGGFLGNAKALDEMLLASNVRDLEIGLAAVGSNDEIASLALLLMRPSRKVWERMTKEIKGLDTGTLDAAFEGLATTSGLEVSRLEMGDENGRKVLLNKKAPSQDGKDSERTERTAYMHFSKQEIEEGVVMENRGGMWWDSLIRYKKGVVDVCKGLDLADHRQAKKEDQEGVTNNGVEHQG